MERNIQDLKVEQWQMTTCPVLVASEERYVECGWSLDPICVKTIRGDDYGSWGEYRIGFECGHSFKDMEDSMRASEVI
jgi:hypothetical protein